MGELIVRDDREWRRLNQAIAALETRSCGDRMRLQHLIHALHAARDELAEPRQRAGLRNGASRHVQAVAA